MAGDKRLRRLCKIEGPYHTCGDGDSIHISIPEFGSNCPRYVDRQQPIGVTMRRDEENKGGRSATCTCDLLCQTSKALLLVVGAGVCNR